MKKLFLLFSILTLGFSFAGLPARSSPLFPHLAYVESSEGLTPPELEGGRTEVEMGDVNQDGQLDLVSIGDHGSPYIGTDQHGIMVWFGDGAGTWSVYQNGDFGYGGVALGDADGDGLLDAGYSMHHNYSGDDFGDQLIEVARGDGSGMHWTPWDDGLATNGEDYGMFATDFADVDNDGDLDLGSTSFGCCSGVHIYLNQGDGSWTQSFGYLGGNSDMFIAFGDVNGDGNADFAVSQEDGSVYLGDGSGDFVSGDGDLPPPGLQGRPGVSLRDVDHDGRADLSFCNSNGGFEVWRWASQGDWQDISGALPGSGSCEATQLFDMNVDGQVDLVGFGERHLTVWAGDGAGGWTEIATFNTPSPGYLSALRVGGDADHNGFPDIVIVADEGSWPNDRNHAHFYKESSTPEALSVAPLFPSGYETVKAGAAIFVDWISAVPQGEAGEVSLELSLNGPGGPWLPVAEGLPDNGRYQWATAPDLPSTQDAYIRYTLVVTPEVATALTPAPFTILGGSEQPISGLSSENDSPTYLGSPTTFTATVETGTNVAYEWDFGDGGLGAGQVVSHTYLALGAYTATVTATNTVSFETALAPATVVEAPDRTPPEVLATQPIQGDQQAGLEAALVITFSEAILPDSLGYNLQPDAGGWGETWSQDGGVVALQHDPLAYATAYTFTLASAADLAGNRLAAPYRLNFITLRKTVLLYLPVLLK